ncbi:MAG: SDR family oxidoreductase [Alphaproteobacteria bacterium]|nr:MAG: SDR family oxidoreductase [Alphaproteobacteria bacterium]
MKANEGLSVLVTGGGSGIGEATARYFAERGGKVTICGRRAEKIKAAAASIGGNCHGVVADVTRDADRKRMIEEAVAFGGGLDALVNNAANTAWGAITELQAETILDILNTNVVAGMMLTGLAAPHLAQRKGAVIFIGSIHTRRAFPGASPYAASKGAVQVLTKVLAAELGAQGVRVNCVLPGAVLTEINIRAGVLDAESAAKRLEGLVPLHALDRVGKAEEIAEAIDYLVRAEWTTGALLDVDGGLGLGKSKL